jgi:hypothetical protein
MVFLLYEYFYVMLSVMLVNISMQMLKELNLRWRVSVEISKPSRVELKRVRA